MRSGTGRRAVSVEFRGTIPDGEADEDEGPGGVTFRCLPWKTQVQCKSFAVIPAVEPKREFGDFAEYLRRLEGKLLKLRRVADFFAQNWSRASSHTNFEMAARSLPGCVGRLEELLAQSLTDSETL